LRTKEGIDKLISGLRSWAQVNGMDDLPITRKTALDVEYMEGQSFWFSMYVYSLVDCAECS
tara:strand:+ start:173 stop:355 length:183 start_codon:yes stop_codon:yes gene_type:complete